MKINKNTEINQTIPKKKKKCNSDDNKCINFLGFRVLKSLMIQMEK